MTQHKRDFCDKFGYLPSVKVGEIFPAPCRCERESEMASRERERLQKAAKERVNRMRERGIADMQCRSMTFENDAGYNLDIRAKSLRYAENFDKMLAENIGLLFTGGVGTGKTFFAACIVNALIDKGVFAMLTSLSRVINTDRDNVEHVLRAIEQADLVAFDDVGSERDTSFAYERAFDAIDARVRARKPMIITTNLTPEELGNVTDIKLKRIYDRILGACVPIMVNGGSARVAEQRKKTESARGLLLGESLE